ncbi:RNA-binding protein [Balneolaceae bacterium ANBcel3]|nr:RNA-binding protein [Balneolaceae bacterium ANBcel3]
MNIYVGNLAWKAKRQDLKDLFENFGEVRNVFIVRDKKTRRSRGFGFVEMAIAEEAEAAIEKLNNTVFLERTIVVNEAKPKDENEDGDVYDDDSDEDEDTDPDQDS